MNLKTLDQKANLAQRSSADSYLTAELLHVDLTTFKENGKYPTLAGPFALQNKIEFSQ